MFPWFKVALGPLPIKSMQGAPLSVFLVLSAHQDETGIAGCSYRTLERWTGYARRTCIDAVKLLEDLKLVEKQTDGDARRPLCVKILRCSSVGKASPTGETDPEEWGEEDYEAPPAGDNGKGRPRAKRTPRTETDNEVNVLGYEETERGAPYRTRGGGFRQ